MKVNELLTEVKVNFHISKTDKGISKYSDALTWKLSSSYILKPDRILSKLPNGKVQLANVKPNSMVLLGVDSDDKVTVIVDLAAEGKGWKVKSLIASDKNQIPAEKVYGAFVKDGNILISGSQQSLGGMSVWKKLSKEPNVNVYGWDKKANEPVNLGDEFDDESDSHVSPYLVVHTQQELKNARKEKTLTPKDNENYKSEIKHLDNIMKNVVLVATKKK